MLFPTELGEVVTKLMRDHFAQIVNTEFTANIEEQLDEVAEGQKSWRKVLEEFYGPFEKTLEKAETEIEKVEIKDRVSDVICEKCGANMVYKMGRFGSFLACPNYPECKNTKSIVEKVDVPCPKCGNQLIKRRAKKGNRVFYGCEKFPECDFISSELPAPEKCPECGAYMIQKHLKGSRKLIYKCTNKDCGFQKEPPQEKTERGKLNA